MLLASRLFALPISDPSVITELDPLSGAEVHRFNAPAPAAGSGANGLAFDGDVLYYMPDDGTARLWQLDPDDGSVIRSTAVNNGGASVPLFDGLGAVGGKVYLQAPNNHQLIVVDPANSTVVNQLTVAADLLGGLTGADGPDELVATENFTTAVRIDPTTGEVLGRFGLPGTVTGAAFVEGKLYFGSPLSGQIFVTDRTGNLLTTLSTPYPVSALAGDGVIADSEPAVERIVNGGFETGDFTGWANVAQPGSFGPGFLLYGDQTQPTPPNLPAPEGHYAAISTLHGPGTAFLYQDVVLPAGQAASLSLRVAYNNQAAGFYTPETLDSLTIPGLANQQFRIDVVDPAADLLSTSAGDILLNVFQTSAGDPNALAPTTIHADLSAFAGRTVRLRIAIAQNQYFFDAIVDSVSLQTSEVPAPTAPTAYYVADVEDFGGGTGKIVRIDAATGVQTVVSSGGLFIDPYGVVEAPDGSLIVVDQGSLQGTGSLFRVDPVTGAQSVISTGGHFIDPFEVVVAPDGSLLVADFGTGGLGRVVRVDPVTGAQTLLSDQGMLQMPFGIAVAPDGSIYAASQGYTGETGQVFRIDPVTGVQTLIATGGDLVDPQDIVVAPDGSLLVADPGAFQGQGAIFRIDTDTGSQSLLIGGDVVRVPYKITLSSDGRLIVFGPLVNESVFALIAVDLTTHEQTVLYHVGPDVQYPGGIAVGTADAPVLPTNTPPTANAGGPYSVDQWNFVRLDASASTDPDQDPASLSYRWDLNGNGVFGETGLAATHGDEVGVRPGFFAGGLPGGSTWTVSLEVTDAKGLKSLATSTIGIQAVNAPPPGAAPTAYYVADVEVFGGGSGKIVRIDAATGVQTVVSSGGLFIDPYGVVEAPDGSLIVVDQGFLQGTGSLIRVHPVTGAQSVISTGGYFIDPFEVVVAPDGSLLVADFGTGGLGRVVRVDPATGAQTLLSDQGMLQMPFGIAVAPDGTIYAASQGYTGETGQVFRIDPVTGVQTLIATGGGLVDPQNLVVAPNGTLLVADPGALQIFRVDPVTGSQVVLVGRGPLRSLKDLALSPDGRLMVLGQLANDADSRFAITAVDLTTATHTVVAIEGIDWRFAMGIGLSTWTPPANTPPTANAGGPYSVDEGSAVALDASGSTDPDQDPASLVYRWDLNGNGVFGETGAAADRGDEVGLHPVFSAAGLTGGSAWPIQLEVTDAQGRKSVVGSTITIENRPPIVTLGPNATVDAAAPFVAQGAFTDLGAVADFHATIDYGDGSGLQTLALNADRTFDLNHVYERAGSYTIVVSVTDGAGAAGASSIVVTVNPLAPVLYTLAGVTIPYGQDVVTLHGVITGGAGVLQGGVEIALAGVTQTAAIDPATGEFHVVFSTATLGARDVPYAVAYHYAGDGVYASADVSTGWLRVERRALQITAQNATKVYGAPDPVFSATFDGFAPGEGPNNLDGVLEFTTAPQALNQSAGVYTIVPSGLSSPNYAITIVPGVLTVVQATTTVTELDTPTVVVGTASTTFTGRIQSNSVTPAGQTVYVTILGPDGPVASGTGTVGGDGWFSAAVATANLAPGSFTVRYEFAGDANFQGSVGTGGLAVSTSVAPLYNPMKAVRAGSVVPIKIAVRDASGGSLVSRDLVVKAVQIVDAQGTTYPVNSPGNANPGGVFRATRSSYQYNLKTRGLAPGRYTLLVTVGDDPVVHALEFEVKSPGRFWNWR